MNERVKEIQKKIEAYNRAISIVTSVIIVSMIFLVTGVIMLLSSDSTRAPGIVLSSIGSAFFLASLIVFVTLMILIKKSTDLCTELNLQEVSKAQVEDMLTEVKEQNAQIRAMIEEFNNWKKSNSNKEE